LTVRERPSSAMRKEQQEDFHDSRETLDLRPDTARLLGLGRGTVYEAARRGEIPTIRIGRRILVPRRALEKLLEGDR